MKNFFFLTSAFLIITAAICVGDEVPQYDQWASVAFSRQRALTASDAIGRAYSESSEFVAKDMAIRSCHSEDCEIKAYVETGCIGIAQGQEVEITLNWWGFGAAKYLPIRMGSHVQTPDEAKRSAQKAAGEAAKVACDSASHSLGCNITEVFCTWDVGPSGSSTTAIRNWIAQMGGESSFELKTLVESVNVANQSIFLNLGVNYTKSSCLVARRWAKVGQFAERCSLSIDELDRLHAFFLR